MYREDVICAIKNGVDRKDNLEALYSSNLGLFYRMGTEFGRGQIPYDDMMQVAYLSLVKAVEAYRPDGRYPFQAYFRKCYFHDCFMFRMENCYAFRLNQDTYRQYESSVEESYEVLGDLPVMDLAFEQAELRTLGIILWDAVRRALSEESAYAVEQHYRFGKTYSQIAEETSSSECAVKQRCFRALARLRRDSTVRQLAEDYKII